MIRSARTRIVAAVVFGVMLACGGIVGVNELMAQDAKPQAAQPAQPATRAAQAAAQSVDASTPKAALRAFAKAARMADYETLQRLSKTDTENELENELIKATNEFQKSAGMLLRAIREKFGEGAASDYIERRGIPLQNFIQLIERNLDQYEVDVQGDTARLVHTKDPQRQTNILLVREGGVWKVASTGLTAQWGKELVAERVGIIRERTDIVSGFAEEVAAGKYESVEAMKTALAEASRR